MSYFIDPLKQPLDLEDEEESILSSLGRLYEQGKIDEVTLKDMYQRAEDARENKVSLRDALQNYRPGDPVETEYEKAMKPLYTTEYAARTNTPTPAQLEDFRFRNTNRMLEGLPRNTRASSSSENLVEDFKSAKTSRRMAGLSSDQNETPPDEALYYNDLEWEPINTDRLEQTQFSDWLHGNSDDKPSKMNCYEGVCYDLLSRKKLDKEKLRERLTADLPGDIQGPTVGRTYSDSLLSVLDPKSTRGTISYDDVKSGKHNIPAGSVIFANDASPGDHVFMTRTGENNPVRSLWSKGRGTGNFSRSWLQDVVDEFYKGKEMDGEGTTLRYNTAFADPVLQQMR